MRLAALAALASVLVPDATLGEGVDGRALLSYQAQDASTFSSSTLRQTYDLRVRRRFTEPVEYRLRLRYEDDRGESRFRGSRSDVGTSQLQPLAELLVSLGRVATHASYEHTWLDSREGNERQLSRAFARVDVTPRDLPSSSLDAERRVSRDEGAGLDQVESAAGIAFVQEIGGWQLRQSNRVVEFEDGARAFERRQIQLQAGAAFEAAPSARRVTGNVAVNASAVRMEETFLGASGGLVPREIAAARGLYAVDDLPADSSDHPLAAVPALVDGNLAASAGISIGPDGASFQNVGVDMGRFIEIDELRIYARNADGNPLPTDGLVTWTAYGSADGSSWIPAGATRSVYFAPLGYYQVQFDRTTARYFKAVSFGVNTLQAFVTEVQAVVNEEFRPRDRRVNWNVAGMGTGQVQVRISERTTLGYTGLANYGRQTSGSLGASTFFDVDQMVAATYESSRQLTLDARVQYREVFPGGAGQRATATGVVGTARVLPLPTLEHALGAGWTAERATSREVDTATVTLRNVAHVYPTLDVLLDAGYTWQGDRATSRSGDRYSGATSVRAQLTRDLGLTLAGAWSRAYETTAPIQAGQDDRYFADVSWRASSRLNLGARVGWVEASSASGLTQRYRVYWNPFQGGSIQLGVTYDEDVDSFIQQRSRRFSIYPRWQLNRHASLDLNYSLFTRNMGENPRTELLFATFTLTI